MVNGEVIPSFDEQNPRLQRAKTLSFRQRNLISSIRKLQYATKVTVLFHSIKLFNPFNQF